ncbi:hypothetical protein [Streptomyces sp. Midd1]|uniref:hypothetical protein n=1 Tax=Streptomyces sp. Midd3 TaxID=3161191 RepID=UPI0034DAE21C
MMPVADHYLDWQTIAHAEPCPAPVWEPQLRFDRGVRGRLTTGDIPHGCQGDEGNCGHGPEFDRVTVRLVCMGCGVVFTVSGEDVGTAPDTTTVIGYGLPPQELGGVWLWPGEQTLPGTDDEPRDWLVTRIPVRPTRPDDVAGTINRHRSAGGHKRWQASAIADTDGPFGDSRFRWGRRLHDARSVLEAAEWIAAQYVVQAVEVSV